MNLLKELRNDTYLYFFTLGLGGPTYKVSYNLQKFHTVKFLKNFSVKISMKFSREENFMKFTITNHGNMGQSDTVQILSEPENSSQQCLDVVRSAGQRCSSTGLCRRGTISARRRHVSASQLSTPSACRRQSHWQSALHTYIQAHSTLPTALCQ